MMKQITLSEELTKKLCTSESLRYGFLGATQPPHEETVERLKNAVISQGISSLEEWTWLLDEGCVKLLWPEDDGWFAIMFVGHFKNRRQDDHIVQFYSESKSPLSYLNISEHELKHQIQALRRWQSRRLQGIDNNNPL